MAFTHRSISYSSFGRSPASDISKRPLTAASLRQKTASDHDFRSGGRLTTPITAKPPTRPTTPSPASIACTWASEAHIHRIRSANQTDYKAHCRTISSSDRSRYFQVTSLEEPLFWPKEDPVEIGDCSDVESINWASPCDITAYLYKPEYVIFPKQEGSVASGAKDTYISNASLPFDCDAKTGCNDGSGDMPAKKGDDEEGKKEEENLMKKDILASYVNESRIRSRRRNKFKSAFDIKLADYKLFAKQLAQELRDLETKTKRLDNIDFAIS